MLYFILLLFGLGMGSFVNAVAMRYKPKLSVFHMKILGGRSHCDYCRRKLKWYELIPVLSFLIQKGRCRSCRVALSPRHLFVELGMGLFYVALPYSLNTFYGMSHALFTVGMLPFLYYVWVLIWLFIGSTFFLIALIDLRHYLIPDELNILLLVLGIGLIVLEWQGFSSFFEYRSSFIGSFAELLPWTGGVLERHLLGAFFGSLFFMVLVLVSRGRAMGIGDVKLAFVSGLIFGWPDIMLVIALSFVIGSIGGIYLMLRGKKKLKGVVPFAPFFVLSTLVVIFFGYDLVRGYFDLFWV